MFNSRQKLYLGQKQKRKPLSLFRMLVWFPLLILIIFGVSEIGIRLFFLIAGKPDRLTRQPDNSPLSQAYQLQFLTNNQPIQGLPQQGNLKLQRNPVLGYQLVANQQSQFWQINEQGWRERVSIPKNKASNEVRVFLLGGSAAFGYRSDGNQDTIAQKLEQRLNQRVQNQQSQPQQYQPEVLSFYGPDRQQQLQKMPRIKEGNYQVINAAIPGYASGNQRAQLAMRILPYNPDLIIVMGGYKNLMLPSQDSFADLPLVDTYLSNATKHFRDHLGKPLQNFAQKSDLLQMATSYVTTPPVKTTQETLVLNPNPNQPLDAYLPQQPSELVERIERYRENNLQMVRLSAGAQVPLISVVQPEITGRNLEQLPQQEKEIINELGNKYVHEVQNAYTEIGKTNRELEQLFPQNVESVNLYNSYTNFSNRAFVDPIHLTSEANTKAAEELYQTIVEMPKMQMAPKQPGN
ncbi:MAG: SGNH/GDSL hydrolase family protein [Cyanobacteria bacterium SW_9_44_58]|nr:MAG: SGNH/GDSL hydrolase family protein [Cyanobacteria bacterium SW_9_44_58]